MTRRATFERSLRCSDSEHPPRFQLLAGSGKISAGAKGPLSRGPFFYAVTTRSPLPVFPAVCGLDQVIEAFSFGR
jgi:hypothetical protein